MAKDYNINELEFPLLTKEDIEVRVGGGGTLLLYKTARTDARILDTVVGKGNWQKKFYTLQGVGMGEKERSIVICSVGIYDKDKHEWIWKDDSGTESQVEQDKGVCSDAFKRAAGGSSWGIGRELYTAPRIPIPEQYKKTPFFDVGEIGYDKNGNITDLVITTNFGKDIVFSFKNGRKVAQTSQNEPKNEQAKGFTKQDEEQIAKFQGFNTEPNTISLHDKTVLEAYLNSTDEQGKDKFYNYIAKNYGTMVLSKLSELQGDELVKMFKNRGK